MPIYVKFSARGRMALHTDSSVVHGVSSGSKPIKPSGIGLLSNFQIATPDASGKRKHQPISIQKEVGSASPLLWQALSTNETFTSVKMVFTQPGPHGKSEEPYFTISLTNASISGVRRYTPRLGGEQKSHDTSLLEDVEFIFQAIAIENLRPSKSTKDNWFVG